MNWLRERVFDLVEAWSDGVVRRGFLATLLLAIGSLAPAYLPANSPVWPVLRTLHAAGLWAKVVGTIISLLGLGLLVDAWFRLRPFRDSERPVIYRHVKHWAVLAIWGFPFLFAPPIFSHDAYSYAAQGWLIHNGINPYQAGPGVLPGAFADQVSWVWRYTPAPYGPLALQISHLLVVVGQFDPYVSSLLMRVPAVLGVAMIVFLTPRIAQDLHVDPAFTAWLAVLNPMIVIDFVGGCHNDALMMGLVVLAIWLSLRGRWMWLAGAIVLGVSAAIKQPAVMACYALPLIRNPWRDFSPRRTAATVARVMVSFALAVGVFSLLSIVTGLGFGWYNAVSVPGSVLTISPFALLGFSAQKLLTVQHWDPTGHLAITTAHTISLTLVGIILATLALTVARRRPITFLSWGYLAVAILGPALHSWYVLWGLILLPLTRPKRRVVRAAVAFTVILLSYAAIDLGWRNGAPNWRTGSVALVVAAIMGYLWQVRVHFLTESRHLERSHADDRVF